jgi:hypothetical protein
MFKLHVRTYELDDQNKFVPVLEHVFFGKTKAEAEHTASSHEKTDTFFKSCGAGAIGKRAKVWRGIKCWAEWWWEKT